jgi:hypothetical protein
MNWKGNGRERSGHNLKYPPSIYLKGLEKIKKNLSQNNRSPDRRFGDMLSPSSE